jgi:hypothetical protein
VGCVRNHARHWGRFEIGLQSGGMDQGSDSTSENAATEIEMQQIVDEQQQQHHQHDLASTTTIADENHNNNDDIDVEAHQEQVEVEVEVEGVAIARSGTKHKKKIHRGFQPLQQLPPTHHEQVDASTASTSSSSTTGDSGGSDTGDSDKVDQEANDDPDVIPKSGLVSGNAFLGIILFFSIIGYDNQQPTTKPMPTSTDWLAGWRT